jgi:hypothetical protein
MTDPGLVTHALVTEARLQLADGCFGDPSRKAYQWIETLASALDAAQRREQALERFVQHGDCAKWGPLSEHPRHLHSTIACTCGLIAALTRAEPPEAKS